VVVLGEHCEAVQHQHPQSVSSPTKIFSGNGVSVEAMCALEGPSHYGFSGAISSRRRQVSEFTL